MSRERAAADMASRIRIFVGADRSQLFAVKVLEYSIRRHTQRAVDVVSLDEVAADLPQPEDLRHGARTGFSFSRFAIPRICDFLGRAIYFDADMQVFADVADLHDRDFGDFHVLIAREPKARRRRLLGRRRRVRQSSVMLIDCERCRWDASEIIAGLGRDYSYEQLMHELCIVDDPHLGAVLPPSWNSLEHFDESTRLLHFTDMRTQPWVEPAHPFGYVWVNELRRMLNEGVVSMEELEREIALGYLRPSLLCEVRLGPQTGPSSASRIEQLRAVDVGRGFVKHRAADTAARRRRERTREIEAEMSLLGHLRAIPSMESTHVVARAKLLLRSLLQ